MIIIIIIILYYTANNNKLLLLHDVYLAYMTISSCLFISAFLPLIHCFGIIIIISIY